MASAVQCHNGFKEDKRAQKYLAEDEHKRKFSANPMYAASSPQQQHTAVTSEGEIEQRGDEL